MAAVGSELPEIERSEFSRRLRACSPEPLADQQIEALRLHYAELRRWNPTVSLVGPIDAGAVVERHYGESLAALPFLRAAGGALLDLGTGAGFPGFVLAVARPELQVTLVEARARKWSFLKSVCRSATLSCICLNARVDSAPVEGLPREIDWITTRAVRFENLGLPVLLPRLKAEGSILVWGGSEMPDLPSSLRLNREAHIEGSRDRRILEIVRSESALVNE